MTKDKFALECCISVLIVTFGQLLAQFGATAIGKTPNFGLGVITAIVGFNVAFVLYLGIKRHLT